MCKIIVTGTIYVRQVSGVCFSEMDHHVTCDDIDEDKINVMWSELSPIYENGLETLTQNNYADGRIRDTTDCQVAYKDTYAIFISVDTPEQANSSTDLSYITTASGQVTELIEKDCLIGLKSTVPCWKK